MRIGRIIERTRAEGPGLRFAVWVQGCPFHCPGCYAETLQDPDGGQEVSADRVIEQIRLVRSEIEGVTLLGGEPFVQAAELAEVASASHAMGLSVLTFTGFLHEELLSHGTPEQKALLSHTDVLLDGQYIEAKRDLSRPLIGSENQRYVFLSGRYSLPDLLSCKNRMELRVDKNGVILLNGMGDFAEVEKRLCRDNFIKGDRMHAIHRL